MDAKLLFAAGVVLCVGASCTVAAPDDDEGVDLAGDELRRCRDDGNACTSDVWEQGRCRHRPLADGTACPNGTCQGGTCRASSPLADAGAEATSPDSGSSAPDAGGGGGGGSGAGTIQAASCAREDVQNAINAAVTGNTVVIPAGTCTWTAGVTVQGKGIHLTAFSKGAVTLVYNAGASATLIALQEHSARSVEVSNLRFVFAAGGSEAWHGAFVNVGGAGKPILLHDNFFELRGRRAIAWYSAKGVIWNNEFSDPEHSPTSNAIVFIGAANSWTTADTMGTRDVTGESNTYVEDNVFREVTTQALDPDSNSRVVIRHNTFLESGMASHGADTSTEGTRHWEIYDNTFTFTNRGDCDGSKTLALNWFFYIRGGTGVIADNTWADINSCAWANKPELNMIVQNVRRNSGLYPCWKTYPAPHQIGQSHNGITSVTDPVYIWGNSGGGNSNPGLSDYSPNECGVGAPSVSDFIKAGRDYVVGTAKPGYSKFAYPHPLRSAR